jgi:hypothetical protein
MVLPTIVEENNIQRDTSLLNLQQLRRRRKKKRKLIYSYAN